MHGGAVVAEDAGRGQLAGPGAATDLVIGLEHGDVDARARQGDRVREAVRPRADHDGGAHVAGEGSGAAGGSGSDWRCSTSTGKSHDPPSHGCASAMSRTLIDPSSINPVAAS